MFGFGFRLYGMEMVSVQTRGNPMPVIRAGDLRSSLSIGSLWSAVAEDSSTVSSRRGQDHHDCHGLLRLVGFK